MYTYVRNGTTRDTGELCVPSSDLGADEILPGKFQAGADTQPPSYMKHLLLYFLNKTPTKVIISLHGHTTVREAHLLWLACTIFGLPSAAGSA